MSLYLLDWGSVMETFRTVRMNAQFDEFMSVFYPKVLQSSIDYHGDIHHSSFARFRDEPLLWYQRVSGEMKSEYELYMQYCSLEHTGDEQ